LETVRPELLPAPGGPEALSEARGNMHEFWARLVFNHPSGFFARAESLWFWQDTRATASASMGSLANQVNSLVGWRFRRNRGELSAGVLNMAGNDYRLSPLTPYADLPRERVFVGRVKLSF